MKSVVNSAEPKVVPAGKSPQTPSLAGKLAQGKKPGPVQHAQAPSVDVEAEMLLRKKRLQRGPQDLNEADESLPQKTLSDVYLEEVDTQSLLQTIGESEAPLAGSGEGVQLADASGLAASPEQQLVLSDAPVAGLPDIAPVSALPEQAVPYLAEAKGAASTALSQAGASAGAQVAVTSGSGAGLGSIVASLGSVGLASVATAVSTSGGAVAFSTTAAVGKTVVTGSMVAGPVIADHQLSAVLYDADGVEHGRSLVGEDGSFRIEATRAITGTALVRIVDATDGADYLDEASNAAKDLQVDLRAAFVMKGPGDYKISVTPLTELATRKLGVADNANALAGKDAGVVEATNKSTAQLFGLEDIIETKAVAVNTTEFATAAANEQKYGVALATLSGLDKNQGGTQAALTKLAEETTIVGNSTSMSSAIVGKLLQGADTADATNPDKKVYDTFVEMLGLKQGAAPQVDMSKPLTLPKSTPRPWSRSRTSSAR
jgi:hypothetical protein